MMRRDPAIDRPLPKGIIQLQPEKTIVDGRVFAIMKGTFKL